jgi:two-component system, OmpR family, phosphate regulon sensor histidine kinase PhoR
MTAVRFPWQVFTRVILVQSVLVLLAVGFSTYAARTFFKKQFVVQSETQLSESLKTLRTTLPSSEVSADWCREHAKDTLLRLKLTRLNGSLVCESRTETLREAHAALPLPEQRLFLVASLPLDTLTSSLRVIDGSAIVFMLLLAAGLGVFAIWSGRALIFPIGRLLVKTQSVLEEAGSTQPAPSSGSGADLLEEEPFGEWSELESSIDDIRRDLMAKAESLSIEREELATLMGAISDAILAIDVEGKPLFFNSRFALLYGNQEALSERSVRLWEMFRVPEILEAFKKALTLGHTREVKAVSLEREGENKRFYSISVAPLRKQTGDIYGAVGVFHDVTDLKGAEQIRIDFVANVSHELRTPLTSIKGYTDTLLLDVQDGKPVTKDFLDIISRNVDRLMNLIRDLLDLSSLESTDVLHKTPINTAEATSRIVRQLQGGVLAKQQSIVEQIGAPVVLADSRRLDQVLTNLLENANKYTPPGGVIRVSWEMERGGVLLRVSDNGPGIPPEHHARLFERFYRVDKARSRDQGGTGLGLAIVKHIMQRHDGMVWVESQAGHGSTFACRFPG